MDRSAKCGARAALGLLLVFLAHVLSAAGLAAGEPKAEERHLLYVAAPGIRNDLEFGGAGLLVFVLALGFYVTPALLGSPRETMIAQTIMVEASQLLDWPQASAAGAVLLVITTAIAAIYNRYFSLDRLWGGSDK